MSEVTTFPTPVDADAAHSSARIAEQLNSSCFCINLDRARLYEELEREAGDPAFSMTYLRSREHLFSNVPVFLARRDLDRMTDVVNLVEKAASLPAYQNVVLSWAPEIARFDPGLRGVFMGYDFHLAPDGPKLIEVNTNAGGALLNALLAKAQRACCPAVVRALRLPLVTEFDASVIGMFKAEWALQRGHAPLARIAVVDDAPKDQYLYPEFLLAVEAFRRHGIEAVIADGAALRFDRGKLWAGDVSIDLVYNRLVDFSLSQPQHAALRDAYLAGAVVVTPNPRGHALLADKRNLAVLSERTHLARLGIPSSLAQAAASIPHTQCVTAENAPKLWEGRKDLFFKPATGHGAKAVYRGDKVTRGVWEHIVAGGYVAQQRVAPGERMIALNGIRETRKADVRLFTYDGRVLLTAARLYQGQTTNFRTPGGGFAPVFFI
jgi:hypothetical protein